MRRSEPGGGVTVAIVASRAPGRWAWVVNRRASDGDSTTVTQPRPAVAGVVTR